MSRPTADDGRDHLESEEAIAPADAFALLGEETRIAILQAMLDADAEVLSFSDLFERVPVEDSALFNYHLDRLTDHFVRKTDEGYAFRYPGKKVVRAVFAGSFTDRAEIDAFETGDSCHACGGPLVAWYADDVLTVECDDCGERHVRHAFPPGGVADRTAAELLDAFHHYVRHHYCLAADGVCPECTGKVETSVVPGTEDLLDLEFRVDHVCQRCGHWLYSAVGLNLLDDADVLSFHADRGVDLTTEPFWHFDWCVSDDHTTVVGRDPLRLRIDIPCAGDVLAVTVDDRLAVRDVERLAEVT